MISRSQLFDLNQKFKKEKIDLSEITRVSNNFLTHIEGAENSKNIYYNLSQSRYLFDSFVQYLLANFNPAINRYVMLDNDQNSSYEALHLHVAIIKENLKEIIKTSASQSQIVLGFSEDSINHIYISSLRTIFENVFYSPLVEASKKYLGSDDIVIEYDVTEKGISFKIPTTRDKELFWFLVFQYVFRSAQIHGSFIQSKQFENINKTFTIYDIKTMLKPEMNKIKKSIEGLKKEERSQEPTNPEDDPFHPNFGLGGLK